LSSFLFILCYTPQDKQIQEGIPGVKYESKKKLVFKWEAEEVKAPVHFLHVPIQEDFAILELEIKGNSSHEFQLDKLKLNKFKLIFNVKNSTQLDLVGENKNTESIVYSFFDNFTIPAGSCERLYFEVEPTDMKTFEFFWSSSTESDFKTKVYCTFNVSPE
jgi:hypothetical protein